MNFKICYRAHKSTLLVRVPHFLFYFLNRFKLSAVTTLCENGSNHPPL